VGNVIQACIFDLDGVVVFTDRYHYLGWQRLASEQGWDFDEKLGDRLRGVGRMDALEIILEHNGLELAQAEKDQLADTKNEYYKAYLQNIGQEDVYPGSVEFIQALKERGVPTALASASKNAPMVLENLGISSLFDTAVTGHDLTRTKPDPQIFQIAAERLDMEPGPCCVFEDAVSGIEAATAAGMHSVGVGPSDRIPNAYQCTERYEEIDIDRFLETGRI
jgi:beta-phosphoglucomutase